MSDQLGCWPLSEPFPALLTDSQLMRVFGISVTQFYALKKLNRFAFLEVQPRLLKRTRYSGSKVEQYVRGEFSFAQSFGGRRVRHGERSVQQRSA